MQRGWHMILTHSVFVSICAGALCVQSYHLMSRPVHWPLCLAVSCFTLAGYNVYWLISKFHFSSQSLLRVLLQQPAHGAFFFLGTVTGVTLIVSYPVTFPWLLITAVIGGMYALPLLFSISGTRLPVPGVVKTVLLAVVWTIATVLVPLADSEDASALISLLLIRFFFIFMLNIIFDVGDAANDRQLNLRTLATDSSSRNLYGWMAFSIGIYTTAIVYSVWHFLPVLTGVVLWSMVLPVAMLFRKAFSKQSYHFYYLYTDGLMLCSAVATYLAGIV